MSVVPLIGILLVLLVIFMSAPHQQKGLDAMVPQPATERSNDPVDIIVAQVLCSGELRINQEFVAWDRLADRMEPIYKSAHEKLLSFAARLL